MESTVQTNEKEVSSLPTTSRCRRLWNIFESKFVDWKDRVMTYGPLDRVSIKLTLHNKSVLIFTYVDEKNWGLQTWKNHEENMKNKR